MEVDRQIHGFGCAQADRVDRDAQFPGRRVGRLALAADRRDAGVLGKIAEHHHGGQIAGAELLRHVVQRGPQGGNLPLGRQLPGEVFRVRHLAATLPEFQFPQLAGRVAVENKGFQAIPFVLRQLGQQVVPLFAHQRLQILGAGRLACSRRLPAAASR